MRAEENKAAAQIRPQDAVTDWNMKGKTVLFTGASRGMGRFAAIELARLGAEVLVVGHHQARRPAMTMLKDIEDMEASRKRQNRHTGTWRDRRTNTE